MGSSRESSGLGHHPRCRDRNLAALERGHGGRKPPALPVSVGWVPCCGAAAACTVLGARPGDAV